MLDAVRAREDQPVVVGDMSDGGAERCAAIRRLFDADGGRFKARGAERFEAFGELRGLGACTRHEYALAEEGTPLGRVEPAQLFAIAHDIADEEDGGRLEPGSRHIVRGVFDGRDERLLLGACAPADDGGGRIAGASVAHEFGCDGREIAHAHEEDERVDARREFLPV